MEGDVGGGAIRKVFRQIETEAKIEEVREVKAEKRQ